MVNGQSLAVKFPSFNSDWTVPFSLRGEDRRPPSVQSLHSTLRVHGHLVEIWGEEPEQMKRNAFQRIARLMRTIG